MGVADAGIGRERGARGLRAGGRRHQRARRARAPPLPARVKHVLDARRRVPHPAPAQRLVYLHLENRLVTSLLTCDGLALGALRELRVGFGRPAYPHAQDPIMEMVWPRDWLGRRGGFTSFDEHIDRSGPVFATRSYCTIGCTALQQLTLGTCDEGISLASQEVAFLGRVLGQCERPATDKAVLVLAGTSMNTPVAQALLDQTISSVLADSKSLMEPNADFWHDVV